MIMKVGFTSNQPGPAKTISGAERPILELLWRKGPLAGRQVYQEVHRSKSLAYTTVLTLLGRMVKKGSVRRRKVNGLFVFEPAMKPEEFEEREAAAVMKGILKISPSSIVSAFVNAISEWDESKLNEVMEMIEEKRKAGGR